MKSSFKFILPLLALLIGLTIERTSADSHQIDDLGLWINNNITLPVTEKVYTRFQVSPRLLGNVTDFSQFILHSTLGYKVNENLSILQGHAWSTTHIPRIRREQRIYQELVYWKKFSRFNLENRVRLDERFIQNAGSFSFRPRYRLKAFFPLNKSRDLSLVVFDELFLNLTSSSSGPKRGIDQNRIYVGLRKDVSKNVSIEGGYQLQHINSPAPSLDRFNHFVLFNFDFLLPQLIRK